MGELPGRAAPLMHSPRQGVLKLSATQAKVVVIVEDVCSRTRVGEGDYDTLLKDLGVDSLDVTSIFLAIQERLGVRVPDDEIDRLNTIHLITTYLDEKK